MADAGDAVERLYSLPLKRFTAERNALAKQLRADGDARAAKAVAALRKPSIAAWAVNQLPHRAPQDLRALFDAGDELREAHAQLLAGGPPERVQRAIAGEREAIGRLVATARAALADEGHAATEATLEKVAETLEATATDPDAREQVRRGVLTHELQRVGFGQSDVEPEPDAGERPEERPAPSKRRLERLERLRADAEEAEREAAQAEQELERTEEEAAARRREAERARRAADQAEEEAGRARRAAERAREDAERARARADEAAAALGVKAGDFRS